MAATQADDNPEFRRFLRRVWRQDIAPLLKGERAAQRRRAARLGGTLAGGAGLLVDSLLNLKGRPFTRALTVLGSTVGAILPDAWSWRWLREQATLRQRRVVEQRVTARAGMLPVEQALALFDLAPRASRRELRRAWHAFSRRWHPDRAADAAARAEHHLRFVAGQAAYERLKAAYARGELPRAGPRTSGSPPVEKPWRRPP